MDDAIEALQHKLIEARVASVESRQDGQRAMATLIGHMRRFHGWTGNSAGLKLDALVARHNRDHDAEVQP